MPVHPLFVVLSVWDVLSTVIYLTVVLVLLKNRKSEPFNSAYFELFINAGFVDLLAIAFGFFYAKLPNMGLFPGPYLLAHATGPIVKLGNLSSWSLGEIQQLFIAVVAVNRYTAICRPTIHQKIWTPRMVKLISLFCPLFIVLMHAKQWNMQIGAAINNSTGVVELYHGNDEERKGLYAFGFVRFLIYTICVTVLYVSMLRAMLKHESVESSVLNNQEVKMAERERRLALSSCVVFGCQMGLLLYLLLVVIFRSNRGVIKYFYYIAGDILTTANPYSLLTLSSATRNLVLSEIRKCLKLNRKAATLPRHPTVIVVPKA